MSFFFYIGGPRFLNDMNSMLGFREGGGASIWKYIEIYFKICWYAVTPMFCVVSRIYFTDFMINNSQALIKAN